MYFESISNHRVDRIIHSFDVLAFLSISKLLRYFAFLIQHVIGKHPLGNNYDIIFPVTLSYTCRSCFLLISYILN